MRRLTLLLFVLSAGCDKEHASRNVSDTTGAAQAKRDIRASLAAAAQATVASRDSTVADSLHAIAPRVRPLRDGKKIDSLAKVLEVVVVDTSSPPPDTTTQPPPQPQPAPQPPPSGPLQVVPGLVGFGTTTPAGRGGAVCRVTNLNDSGTGSLRGCVSLTGPRVVVFETSGTITLGSKLLVTSPFITIAGQTAPPPGILLRNYGLSVRTHDVLIQHIRSRPGDVPVVGNKDAIEILSPSYNVVGDHLSLSWATDENASTWPNGGRPHDITIANSIIAEGIRASEAGLGLLVGDSTQNFLVIGSLLISNQERNPYFKGGTSGASVNNLVYNWGGNQAAYTQDDYGSGPALMSVVGNQFVRGPSTAGGKPIQIYSGVKAGTRVYVSDNSDGRGANPPSDPWSLVYNQSTTAVVASSPPVWPNGLVAMLNGQVYTSVLANAGAWPASRDAVDARLRANVVNGTGAIPTSVASAGGYPSIAVNVRALTLPADPNGIAASGYTNLEEWLQQYARTAEGK